MNELELLDILKQTINFMNKYKETSNPTEEDYVFMSQEEMVTTFEYENKIYNIFQRWVRDAYSNYYSCNIECDGEETGIDIGTLFVRMMFAVLSKKFEHIFEKEM